MTKAAGKIKEVLAGYANFLKDRQLALPRHRPHLVLWIRELDNRPDLVAAGNDPQLEKAIEVEIETIKVWPRKEANKIETGEILHRVKKFTGLGNYGTISMAIGFDAKSQG